VVIADISFWQAFLLLLIFVPLVLIWGLAVVDIFRRDDIGGGWKAVWLVVVIVLPFIGTLVYLVLRRPGATRQERAAMDETMDEIDRGFDSHFSAPTTSEQLKTLADLHDAGKLSDEEFASAKAKLL
jgi:hypothetical protein